MKKQDTLEIPGAPIGHKAIMASAGSGKTFQLARRYVGLLARGVTPDRICALTFSRKAAGEIFDSIIKALVEAATSETQAEKTAHFIGCPGLAAADFHRILRDFLAQMHTVHTGTLDSFIVGVIRAFPAEVGVPFEFSMMDNEGADAVAMRETVLNRIFRGTNVSRSERSGFLQAFRLATTGEDAKAMLVQLDTFIKRYRRLYQMAPDKALWGDVKHIWPGGCRWMSGNHDISGAAARLRISVPLLAGDERARAAFLAIIDSLSGYSLQSNRAGIPGSSLFKAIMILVMGPDSTGAVSYYRKKYEFNGDTLEDFRTLVFNLFQVEYQRALVRTGGIVAVLETFERHYDRVMRQTGTLTFDDAQYLLTAHNAASGGALMSRRVGEERRLYIDYRLDSRLDHWLIDEFQDTSDLQWAVLSNLIDEIIQDGSGARSFFCVGDIKQAIYGWRGGNPRLFQRMIDTYDSKVLVEPLSCSYRSCPVIIDTVNAVFDDFGEEPIPAAAQSAWREIWQTHASDAGKVSTQGYTALVEALNPDDKGDDAPRMACIAGILQEVDPIARRISAAILVRSNDTGTQIANYLRHACPQIPVSLENNPALADNPVVALIMAMIQLVAHPGDTMAWRHIQMSPVGDWFAKQKWNRPKASAELASQLFEDGFRTFVVAWGRRLDGVIPLDAFGHQRLSQLSEAAAHFDAGSLRDPGLFIEHIANTTIDESDETSMVRIMSIHKAKGLGFDMVILPDLDDVHHPMNRGDFNDVVVDRDPGTEAIHWLVQAPPKALAEHDPVFRETIARDDATAAIDALCVLYVALTRAKTAMYLVSGKTPTDTLSMATFLKHQLAGAPVPGRFETARVDVLHEHGKRTWYDANPRVSPRAPVAAPQLPADFATRAGRRSSIAKIEPSSQGNLQRTGGWYFEREHGNVLDFGHAIHELFKRVEWSDAVALDEIVRDWESAAAYDQSVRRGVVVQFRAALASDAVRAALARPVAAADLWREKSFETIIDDEWISGVFDRVVIERDTDGRALRALVQDYKSNRITAHGDIERDVETYRPQMDLYRRVLARILDLPAERIDAELIFTVPARVMRVV